MRVRVAGLVEPMVDLRDVDADDVGRALGLAGSRERHSRRWLWVRGPDVASLAGSRALRGVWLYGGLPRPSVTVHGSAVDVAGALVQPLLVRVLSSVDGVSVWTVRAVAVGDDGRERAGDAVESEAVGVGGGVVRVGGLAVGQRYVVRGRVWHGGRESVSLWSCGVSVMTSGLWLPPAMRLPAVDLGVDLGALRWGEPVAIDTDGGPRLPSVAALDDDRLLVAWVRVGAGTNNIRAVRRSDGSLGPSSTVGSATIPGGSRSVVWHPCARIGVWWWIGSGTSVWCAVGHVLLGWQ